MTALHPLKPRTALAVLSLYLPCTAAIAEWTQVDHSAETTVLADKSTIRRADTTAKFWTLTNFANVKVIEGKRHQSVKTQFEVDCKEDRLRLLSTTFYSQTDGRGSVVYSTSAATFWEPVAPETIGSQLVLFACSN
jgi:hypothetical protein